MTKSARRYKICRRVKGKAKKSCSYVIRNKKGQFRRWSNIGRSIRVDARVKAKHRPKKVGYGHTGDY